MTSELTRERLQEIAEDGFLKHGEGKELARIALAAMDSEPVVFTDERNLHHIAMGRETSLIWGKQNQEAGDIAIYRHAQPAPVVPDGYVMVPINMTTEQMRAVQRDSTLGTFASAHLNGAFDLYREFWSVAVAASPQEVRKSNVVDTYQGADGKEHEIIYLSSSQKEVK
ncbi:TPA: hypothetical protein ACHB2H_001423 [Klebsiella pneumoniae]